VGKLKLVELFVNLLKCKNQKLYMVLRQYNFFNIILELMVRFEWNNILHILIEKIIINALDTESDTIKSALFEDAKILDFIANNSIEASVMVGGKRRIRKGYVGYLTKISNYLIEKSKSQDWLKE